MKILHLLVHPNIQNSKVNKAWAEILRGSGKLATSRALYIEYPDFKIDVAKEQGLLIAHDKIVLQFPFQWYSTPPLLKKWIDDVLAYGFAYGPGGDKVKGKELQLIISTGGPEEAYKAGGSNNHTMAEFLCPLEQTIKFCGMKFLTPFVMHGAMTADEKKITSFGKKWVDDISK